MAIMFPGTPMERVHRFVCQQIWYYWHLHIKTILAYSNENTSSIPQPSNSESHCSVVLEVISGNVLSNLTVTTQYRNVFYSTCTPFKKKKKKMYIFFYKPLDGKDGSNATVFYLFLFLFVLSLQASVFWRFTEKSEAAMISWLCWAVPRFIL